MERAAKHFMWEYQAYYRIIQQRAAKQVFQALDQRFAPEVFLVGIPLAEYADRFPICVEPEKGFWIESDAFRDLRKIADALLYAYPETRFLDLDPFAEQPDEGLRKRSVQDAIQNIVHDHSDRPANLSYFSSYPARVGIYQVALVIGLQDDVLASYYALEKDDVARHECRNAQVPLSFIQAVVEEFMKGGMEEVQKPDAGAVVSRVDSEELIRSAGNQLTAGTVWQVDQERIEGMYNFFRACNTISSLYYERSIGTGTIILARKEHPALEKVVQFAHATALADYRGARKLLELASHNLALHCDSEEIFGLARIRDDRGEDDDLFEIKILNQHHWELAHTGRPLMRVRYGQPYLPRSAVDEQMLRTDLRRVFKDIGQEHVDRLVGLVREAQAETHGTMLVITEAAAEEAQRLSVQGTSLVPCALTPELLRHLTPIDGAVLLTPEGICHAIGTILDGRVTEKGDPARGARFNSAIRYVESCSVPCLAVVVSEDGGVDFAMSADISQ